MPNQISKPARPVLLVGILSLVESALIVLYGLILLVFALIQGNFSIFNSLMLGGFFILVGFVIGFAARLLFVGKPSGRSLLLVWQLFIIIIGVQTAMSGQFLSGILATILAAAITLLLFSQAVTQHLLGHK